MCAAVANNMLYFCGGITGGGTTNKCGKYSLQTSTFSAMTRMPQGVNHGACTSDGSQKVYVVGGRFVCYLFVDSTS